MKFFPRSTEALLILLSVSLFSNLATSQLQSANSGFISAVISEKGLVFVKDFLVDQAIRSLTHLRLPDIEKSVKIPLIGGVHVTASNIILHNIGVSSSTIQPWDTGVQIVASGANASLFLEWSYTYSTWFIIPVEVSDKGKAFVQVEGLEVVLTISVENKNGNLALNVRQCVCHMEDVEITLDGGATWFYQGFVIAFENRIRSTMENAIMNKIREGIRKLNFLLQSLPKEIDVGDIAAFNVTFVDDPVVKKSSIEFDVNGLFVPSPKALVQNYLHKQSHSSISLVSCDDSFKMLGITVEEAVFNSASLVLFEQGLFHWIVDKVLDQHLLNTASWKFIIPQLYRKYPNDEMLLNISLPSAPVIKISQKGFVATIFSEVIVEVLDGDDTIPVACISLDFTVSGAAEISSNKIVGRAGLNDFSISLKWSKIGNFKMVLIQGVIRVFLNAVVMPYINIHLHKGFPIPVHHGFTLQNAQILTTTSTMVLCSDVAFIRSSSIT